MAEYEVVTGQEPHVKWAYKLGRTFSENGLPSCSLNKLYLTGDEKQAFKLGFDSFKRHLKVYLESSYSEETRRGERSDDLGESPDY